MFILPGIYLIKPYAGSNIYAIAGKDGIYIVDTGFEGNDELILAMIDMYFEAEPEDISGVILTHAHPDHVGSLPEIIDASGATVYVHHNDIEMLKKNVGLSEIPNLVALEGGELIEPVDLKVIHAPGHTLGSVMLYRENEFVITGDVLLTSKGGDIKLPLQKYTQDIMLEIKSALLLKNLNFDILLPGHGPPILEKAKQKYLLFLERLKNMGRAI